MNTDRTKNKIGDTRTADYANPLRAFRLEDHLRCKSVAIIAVCFWPSSVFICVHQRLQCHLSATTRMLYITATCRRPFWNLRDAKIKSLAPAACFAPHGYHGPHTKISARARCADIRRNFLPKANDGSRKPSKQCRSTKRSGKSSPSGPTAHSCPPKALSTGSSPRRRRKAYRFVRRFKRKARRSASSAAKCTRPRSW